MLFAALLVCATAIGSRGQAQAPQPAGSEIKVYTVRAATPEELVEIINKMLPEVTAMLGPQPRFIRDTPLGEALGTEEKKPMPGAASPTSAPPNVNISDQFVRQIILRGSPAAVQQALDLLKEIDTPAPQVLIETNPWTSAKTPAAPSGSPGTSRPPARPALLRWESPRRRGSGTTSSSGTSAET